MEAMEVNESNLVDFMFPPAKGVRNAPTLRRVHRRAVELGKIILKTAPRCSQRATALSSLRQATKDTMVAIQAADFVEEKA